MKIAALHGRKLSPDRPYLIAEAGVNHEGSLSRAIEMVDAASDAGADMIKFQSYKASTLASEHSPAYWDHTAEPAASQFELFKRYDSLDVADYTKLHERCESKGIAFCSTPFDSRFVDALEPLLGCYKIASADITNTPLLRQIASKAKPVLLSTGASTLGEIGDAIGVLEESGAPAIAILHCVLQYPTALENANLRAIGHLAKVFPNATIGYSDHVPPGNDCLALFLAYQQGALILEKHFTLDKSLPGNDHYHSMDPDDIIAFREHCKRAETLLGMAEKTVYECEIPARTHARRSLVTTCKIEKGTALTAEMLVAKRPGHGIPPNRIDEMIGCIVPEKIEPDSVLTWDFLLGKRASETRED